MGGGGWQNPGNSYSSKSYYDSTSSQSSGLGDLILLGVVGIVIYAVYKTCVDAPSMEDREYGTGSTGGGGMGVGGWTNWRGRWIRRRVWSESGFPPGRRSRPWWS